MRTFIQTPKAPQQAIPAKSTILSRAHFEHSNDVNSIIHLRRTLGNQAVERVLQAHNEEPDLALTTAPRLIQAKLAINQLGDEYEQEADRISEQVMRMPEPQLQW